MTKISTIVNVDLDAVKGTVPRFMPEAVDPEFGDQFIQNLKTAVDEAPVNKVAALRNKLGVWLQDGQELFNVLTVLVDTLTAENDLGVDTSNPFVLKMTQTMQKAHEEDLDTDTRVLAEAFPTMDPVLEAQEALVGPDVLVVHAQEDIVLPPDPEMEANISMDGKPFYGTVDLQNPPELDPPLEFYRDPKDPENF